MSENDAAKRQTLIALTSDIVAAHVSNNSVAVGDIPTLIANVYRAMAGLDQPVKVAEMRPEPAVTIRNSIKPNHIVCLEDGKKFKMLKRHLMTRYNMTPDEYRERWNLPADYPMVAPSYAETRRNLAKRMGLGRKPNQGKAAKPAPAKRVRKAPATASAPDA